jgi:alpha-galactosidase
MPILVNDVTREFHLTNDTVSYIFCIAKNSQPQHLYYGKAIPHRQSFQHMNRLCSKVLNPVPFRDDMSFSLNGILHEYPSYGTGDFRTPAFQIQSRDGSRVSDFIYTGHVIHATKTKAAGLPSVYYDDGQASTLELILTDCVLQCEIRLFYTMFSDLPVVARSASFFNRSQYPLKILSAMSICADFDESEFDMITLDGAWCRERHITTARLRNGVQSIGSNRGASSANHNPVCFLKRPNTDEHTGECYAFSLLYSGNFLLSAEVDSERRLRVGLGINPFEFQWNLAPGASFETPEAVTAFSGRGLNDLSGSLHDLIRKHIVRGEWKDCVRPVLINNWEATYFDFNEEKLLRLAECAKGVGVELFVLDDGWFGRRNDDTTSLGDWTFNPAKMPRGLAGLSEKIKAMGLLFGIWVEPEMVSEDSDLFRAHPEWAIGVPDRARSYGRNQYVLDMSNSAVTEHLFGALSFVFESGGVDYVKWDMNRNITEPYGASLPPEEQGAFFHRYILGVYGLYDRLIRAFPHILFESCAAGGGRFDLGMMAFAPQAWASDDTDPAERLKIQYGTSMLYPLSCMSNHVSASPNHQTGRETDISFRFHAALFGMMGYELDLNRLGEREIESIRMQIDFYKQYRKIVQFGRFIRLISPFESDGDAAWMVISEDGATVLMAYYKVLSRPNPPQSRVRLAGLPKCTFYQRLNDGGVFPAEELMNRGVDLAIEFTGAGKPENYAGIYTAGDDIGDFTSQLMVFRQIDATTGELGVHGSDLCRLFVSAEEPHRAIRSRKVLDMLNRTR